MGQHRRSNLAQLSSLGERRKRARPPATHASYRGTVSTKPTLLTPVRRLLGAACCALSLVTLSACVGPGLEPPRADSSSLPGTPNARGAAAAGAAAPATAASMAAGAPETTAATQQAPKGGSDAGGLPGNGATPAMGAATSTTGAPAAMSTGPTAAAGAAADSASEAADEDAGVPDDMGMTP